MQMKGLLWMAPVALVALAVACGGNDKQPVSPTSSSVSAAASGAGAAADGVTLKVNAPALTSPIGGARLTDAQATLTFQAATGKYVSGETFTYRVQLLSAASTVLEEKTGTALTYKMQTAFDTDTTYKWRVRAELQSAVGPWSTTETFKSMLKPSGYIRGNEIYDPLDNGKTVGTIVGPYTWIPGVGLRLDAEESYVEYALPTTLREGEYSVLVSGLAVVSSNEDPKLRVITMREGGSSINDNIYRMSADKRGNGAIAYRFITGDASTGAYIESGASERIPYPFHENLTYFYKATWRGGIFGLTVVEGGVAGNTIYDISKAYHGIYQPSPHMVYLGSPYAAGDRGDPSTLDGMVIRQVWVSPNPRPSWANQ
jgi:hypothetical protein